MLEDRFTIVLLVIIGIVALVVGSKITYDHYVQDKIDNCVLDNLRELKKNNPFEYQYTTINDLPRVRKSCEEHVK